MHDDQQQRHKLTLTEEEKKNVRILLAEDNPINQQVAIRILAKLGYHSDVVKNGSEALEAIKEKSYDLILMDCQMPEMDGYVATAEIRKLEQINNKSPVPIIAVTAHSLESDREKCMTSGMNDYIPKPINIDQLATTIEKWLVVSLERNA